MSAKPRKQASRQYMLAFQTKLSITNHSFTLHLSAPFLKLNCILPYPVRGCNAVLRLFFLLPRTAIVTAAGTVPFRRGGRSTAAPTPDNSCTSRPSPKGRKVWWQQTPRPGTAAWIWSSPALWHSQSRNKSGCSRPGS